MARLVFTTIGSAGDLFPFLPIARELRTRGHEVRFAANPWFAPMVKSEGFRFHPMGPRLGPEEYGTRPEIFDGTRGGFPALQALMKHFILPHLPTVTEDLRAAVRGADLLLAHPAQLAAPMAAELESVRWITLSVFPGNIPSRHTVPQGALTAARGGAVGRLMNASAWWGARVAMRLAFDGDLNRVRRGFGLGPRRDVFLLSGLSDRRVVVLCPPAYCAPPPDWPDTVRCTGYTSFDTPSEWREPAGLEAFLEAGPPPVLLSLGTSVAMDAGGFVSTAEQALDRIGARGLFLVGQESNLPPEPRPPHAHFAYVPLSRVLPRSALVVHPGGFGTVAQVVAAGLPSVVVPRAFDQAYHAGRIEALGIGRALSWDRLSPSALAEQAEAVLADAGIADRCRDLAARIDGRAGTDATADLIEADLREGP